MNEITMWGAWLKSFWFSTMDRSRDERGDITQVVIIVALFAAAAIAISVIIITKFTSKAQTIPTE